MNRSTGFQNLIAALLIQARLARDVNATIVELMTQLQENAGSNERGWVVTTVVENPEIEKNSCPKLVENPETVGNNLCSKLVENPQMAGKNSCPKPVEIFNLKTLKLKKIHVRMNKLEKPLPLP